MPSPRPSISIIEAIMTFLCSFVVNWTDWKVKISLNKLITCTYKRTRKEIEQEVFDTSTFLSLDAEFCIVRNACLVNVRERLTPWWGIFFLRHLSLKISHFTVLKFCKLVDIESHEHIWSDYHGNCINVPQHNSTDWISPAEKELIKLISKIQFSS